MQTSVLTAVLLPIALAIVMLGLGLSLTLADFARVLRFPRAVFAGLLAQVVILPLVCFGIAKGFGLAPALAVGLMLLAASPGGATANLFSHLANGDVALNITLTAVNSVVSLLTLPLILTFSLTHFLGAENSVPLQFSKIIQVFLIVLVPVSIGMLLRAKRPALAARDEGNHVVPQLRAQLLRVLARAVDARLDRDDVLLRQRDVADGQRKVHGLAQEPQREVQLHAGGDARVLGAQPQRELPVDVLRVAQEANELGVGAVGREEAQHQVVDRLVRVALVVD